MKIVALTLMLPVAATAGPAFVDRSAGLPGGAPVYAGGWTHFVGGGVAILDCDGDGALDLFVAGGTDPARLLRNVTGDDGAIAFAPVDLPPMTGVTGAYPLDMDGDGPLDLMVLRVGPNVALRGRGDCTFEDMTQRWGIDPVDAWTTAFSATWEDGQARPTLAFGNYVDRDDPEGPFGACDTNWLVRPEGDGWGAPVPLEPSFCPLSMLFTDWRRDGTPLLRISNDRHYYVGKGYEQMWQLDPLREWDANDGWARQRLWGMGIASGDVTGDGLPEAFLTSMGDQILMRNDGAGFRTVPYDTGTFAQRPHVGDDGRPSTGWHAEFGDIDNDGRLDLFIAKGNVDQMPGLAIHDPNNLLMQGADGRFVEAAADAGVATTARSRGAGLADLNGDGRLDLVVVNRRAPMEVWQNVSAETGGWLEVELRQPGGNGRAVGAVVTLETDDGLQTREVTVGGGHAGGQAAALHFGMGTAGTARLRVTWPDGTRDAPRDVTANRRLTVTRP